MADSPDPAAAAAAANDPLAAMAQRVLDQSRAAADQLLQQAAGASQAMLAEGQRLAEQFASGNFGPKADQPIAKPAEEKPGQPAASAPAAPT